MPTLTCLASPYPEKGASCVPALMTARKINLFVSTLLLLVSTTAGAASSFDPSAAAAAAQAAVGAMGAQANTVTQTHTTTAGGPQHGGIATRTTRSQTLTATCYATPAQASAAPPIQVFAYTMDCYSAGAGSGAMKVPVCPTGGDASSCHDLTVPTSGAAEQTTIGLTRITVSLSSCTASGGNQSCQMAVTEESGFSGTDDDLKSQGQNEANAESADASSLLAEASANGSVNGAYVKPGTNTTQGVVVDSQTGAPVSPSSASSSQQAQTAFLNGIANNAANCSTNVQSSVTSGGSVSDCSGKTSTTVAMNKSCSPGDPNCLDLDTYGEQNQTAEADTKGFKQAISAVGVINSIQREISNGIPPHIFTGAFMTCENKLTGVGGGKCCDINLKKTSGGGFFAKCSMNEIKLAGQRRAGDTHQLSRCCAESLPLVGCIVRKYSFCAFSSELARIVQEQGRQQLAALSSTDPSAPKTTASFPYYTASGGPPGTWAGPYTVGSTQVWAYEWPYDPCVSNPSDPNYTPPSGAPAGYTPPAPGTAAYREEYCASSSDQVYWAVCQSGTCSGAPTATPPDDLSDTRFDYSTTGQSGDATLDGGKIVASGGCNGGACTYTLTGPGGGSGMGTLHSAVRWALYGSASGGYGSLNASGWSAETSLGLKYSLSGYSLAVADSPAMNGPAPTSVKIQYKSNSASANWVTQTLPLSIPQSSPLALGSSGMSIYGNCDGPNYECDYQVSMQVKADLKPWDTSECGDDHAAAHPDCSGFTLQQFMLLNLGDMDLTGWASSVEKNLRVPSGASGRADPTWRDRLWNLLHRGMNALVPEAVAAAPTGMYQAMGDSAAAAGSKMATQSQTAPPPAMTQANATYDRSGLGLTTLKLSGDNCVLGDQDCTVTAYATSNWPQTYPDVRQSNGSYTASGLNTAPVKSVQLNWGDGAVETLSKTALVNGEPLFKFQHTYAAVGNYVVTAQYHMVNPTASGSGGVVYPLVGLQHLSGNPPPGGTTYRNDTLVTGDGVTRYSHVNCRAEHYSVAFTLSANDLANINQFTLESMYYDDAVLITVNGHIVAGGPWKDMTELTTDGSNTIYAPGKHLNGCDAYDAVGRPRQSPDSDITPDLVVGANQIDITLVHNDYYGFKATFLASGKPHCDTAGCSNTQTFSDHQAQAAFQVWQDTPPSSEQAYQNAYGGSETIPVAASTAPNSPGPQPSPQPPSGSFTVEPGTITQGQSATLQWTIYNATRCTAGGDWSGAQPVSGSRVVAPSAPGTYTYTLSCTGPAGSNSGSATLTVVAPPPPPSPPPTLTLTANPSSVAAGGSVRMHFVSNGTTCQTASSNWQGKWTGANGINQTTSITAPTAPGSYTYTMTCTNGSGGSVSASATVTVVPPPTLTFTAKPARIALHGTSTLTWQSQNATSCQWSSYSDTTTTSGSVKTGPYDSYGSTTYTMTCTGVGGSVTKSVTVTVVPPPTVTLTAGPAYVIPHQDVTLNWSSTNADQCTTGGAWGNKTAATGGADSVPAGSVGTATYTLTCTGAGGSATASASVQVVPPVTDTLTVSPNPIYLGQSTTLSWTSQNAVGDCSLSGSGLSAKGDVYLSNGSQSVAPTASGQDTYTLVCHGKAGDSATSKAVLTVIPPPTVTLTANPTTVNMLQSTTLTWTSTNALSCKLSGAASGNEPVNGSKRDTLILPGDENFKMTCTNPAGSGSASATVTVKFAL